MLRGVREEARDGMYTLVLEFETKEQMTLDMWETRLNKIESFFGPGIKAEVGGLPEFVPDGLCKGCFRYLGGTAYWAVSALVIPAAGATHNISFTSQFIWQPCPTRTNTARLSVGPFRPTFVCTSWQPTFNTCLCCIYLHAVLLSHRPCTIRKRHLTVSCCGLMAGDVG